MATVNIKNPNRFVGENILHNWYFVGGGSQQGGGQLPVNTRGQTSYSSAVQYTIDRWKTTANTSTVTVASDGLTISAPQNSTPYLLQRLANVDAILGKTVTLSVLTTSGLKFKTGKLPSTNPSQATIYVDITGFADILYSSGTWGVRLKAASGGSNTFIAVKLELGDTQTLACYASGAWIPYEIPQYGEERMRCFRAMADSSDPYSYNPNAPIWSKTVSAEVNASGVMSFPADVTIDNLISIYEETQVTSPKSIIAIPYKTSTSPASSAVRVYGIGNDGTLSLLSNGMSTFPMLTFVYRL